MSSNRGALRRHLAAALATTCALLGVVPAAHAQDTTVTGGAQVVTNAELRWSINDETRGRAFAPGTYNLISAGDISTAIPGAGKTIDQSAWRQSAGNVHIDRRTADGAVAAATWAGTQQSAGFGGGTQGAALKAAASGDHNGLEAVFTGGEGALDQASGTADLKWSGSMTVLYYSGMSYFTLTDPELEVTGAGATLTATMGAHRASMTDSSIWEKMPSSREVVATFAPGEITLANAGGFSANPQYTGVVYDGGGQVRSNASWGSFPVGFVDYLAQAGAGAYWYSSGGASDRLKVPNKVTVSWDAAAPVTPEPETPSTGGDTGTTTASGARLKKFLDDVTDAAQAKVLENTNRITGDWIDQAFGNAPKTTTPAAPAAGRTATGATATQTTTGRSTTTTSRTAVRDVGDYLVSTGQPVTAGTVGRVVSSTSQPTSTSGSGGSTSSTGRSTSSPATGAQMTQAQSSPAYAAASKQAVDGQPVLYSSTSADTADGPAHYWQWLLGLALLAIAAVLVFLTRTRKA